MGWSNLEEGNENSQVTNSAREDAYRALATATAKAIAPDAQQPLKDFLSKKANTVSYRSGATAADVAFEEGQRSLALQILKLAGEI